MRFARVATGRLPAWRMVTRLCCWASLCVCMLCCLSGPPGKLTGWLIPVASLPWPDGRLGVLNRLGPVCNKCFLGFAESPVYRFRFSFVILLAILAAQHSLLCKQTQQIFIGTGARLLLRVMGSWTVGGWGWEVFSLSLPTGSSTGRL